jgi:hypothetical protein
MASFYDITRLQRLGIGRFIDKHFSRETIPADLMQILNSDAHARGVTLDEALEDGDPPTYAQVLDYLRWAGLTATEVGIDGFDPADEAPKRRVNTPPPQDAGKAALMDEVLKAQARKNGEAEAKKAAVLAEVTAPKTPKTTAKKEPN